MNTSRIQQGSTLIISLIMLVLLTMFALSAINLTNVNLRISGNLQVQEESRTLAQQAIDEILNRDFTVYTTSSGLKNQGSYVVTTSKTCSVNTPIKNSQLDPSNALDKPCFGSGAAQNTGIFFSGSSSSNVANAWCANQQWDISAQVTDSRTSSNLTLHQGTALRVTTGTDCT